MKRNRERSVGAIEVHASIASERSSMMAAAVRASLLRGRTLLEQGAPNEAQHQYRAVLAIDPANSEALFMLGTACEQGGDVVEAEKLFARALRLEQRYAWPFAAYGSVLVRLGRCEDALAPLREALRLDPQHAPAHVGHGNALLGLEQYAQAQAAYERALGITPALPEAWSNRGNALRALGRPADALISFDQALRMAPHNYAAHTNRAHALRDLGRHEDALRGYRLALVARPRVAALLSLCGSMLLNLGRDAEALVSYNEALAIEPNDVDVLYNSCVALDLLHSFDELLARSERILSLQKDHAGAWVGKANALNGLGRYAEASDAYAQALSHDPNLHTALANHEVSLRMLERYAEALELSDDALARVGANTQLLLSRAHTLQQLGRYDDALVSYEAVLAVEPTDAAGWAMRGGALQHLLRFDEAIECYGKMRELDPETGQANNEEAYCQLLSGKFQQGWRNYEYRWIDADQARTRRHTDRPLWSGEESIAGKTLLLHAEQGMGDTLQFCRYASLAVARGASVILELPGALMELIGSMHGEYRVIKMGEPLPDFDLQCPLLSLPLAFNTDLQSIPAPVPYLYANPARVNEWRQRLQARVPAGRIKVGLTWSGNPKHSNDLNRSVRFAALAPLLAQGATFVSLHQEVRERDRLVLAQSGVVHFGAELRDYGDTAALIENLDLVISVDTSVVHLAGALGKPVWILLPRVPDWRWLLERADSPWYPTARLFRQGKPGDWPEVIERVAHELSRQINVNGL